MKARILAALLASVVLAGTTSGCIGRMALSGKVMKFNLETTEKKWGREILFLCLYIIPVYPFSGLIDLLIINSIEFWTGTNPLSGQERLARAGDQHRVEGEDGSVATSTLREDGSIDIDLVTPNGERHQLNVIREDDHVVARDTNGKPIARMEDGQVVPVAPRS